MMQLMLRTGLVAAALFVGAALANAQPAPAGPPVEVAPFADDQGAVDVPVPPPPATPMPDDDSDED